MGFHYNLAEKIKPRPHIKWSYLNPLNNPNQYPGQGLELICNVDLGPDGGDSLYVETAMVHWTVNTRVLQSSTRLQLSSSVLQSNVLQGRLVIASTRASDSGNYSCLPSYATPDWVMVHIVTQDEPAGLQLSKASSCHISNLVFRWVSFPVFMSLLLSTDIFRLLTIIILLFLWQDWFFSYSSMNKL